MGLQEAKYQVVHWLFMASNTIIAGPMPQDEAEELAERYNEDNEDDVYSGYYAEEI